jgi:carbonic anhydrase
VEEVIVMGHGFCGGCAAALTGQFDDAEHGHGHFIADWIELLRDARDRVRGRCGEAEFDRTAFRAMEMEGVRVSIANLRTFPWVGEREAGGTLKLHGAWFSIAEGVLYVLDEASGTFSPAQETE